jgi:putative N6-adenine-specific DNA methylase
LFSNLRNLRNLRIYAMTSYFATCARGLEPVLARELGALNAEGVQHGRGGVTFRGDHALLYRANLWLRTAVRVLRPVMEAEVRSPDELYDAVRTVNWNEYLTPDHTLAVDCNVRDSAITHSQYAARRVKDAVCDQFRERTGRRPSVDVERPMVGFNLHVHKNRAVLSLDSSWDSLHKRGYRPIQTIAPLNEALAAGLLLHSGWDPATALVDPLCGSGTFCVEGAWIALDRAPGLTRKWFAFQGWIDFDRPLWNAVRDEARRKVRKELPAPIVGSDVHPGALELARQNARAAGVGHLVQLLRRDIRQARPPDGTTPGVVICNPPYGERIGEEKEWIPLYAALGETVGEHFPGWRLFVFTSNAKLARKVGLPVRGKTPFFNGKLECQLWDYGSR